MLLALDRAVGRIMQTLKTERLDDDTLVIFTNDHGDYTANGPFHGGKGQVKAGTGRSFPMGHGGGSSKGRRCWMAPEEVDAEAACQMLLKIRRRALHGYDHYWLYCRIIM